MPRIRRSHLLFVAALLQGVTVLAQTASQPARLYRLDKASTFQRGCFAPCLCPVLDETPLSGTFILRRTGSDWLYDYYDVTNVRWQASVAGVPTRITGSGTYRIGGEVALEQLLDLDLVVGEEPVQRFFSGRVVGSAAFPRIDLTVSINGVYCHDTVLSIASEPVPEITVEPGQVSWEGAMPSAVSYDVVVGSLSGLRGGDVGAAVEACLADGTTSSAVSFTTDPPPGTGYWFLVRESDGAGAGSYDTGDVAQTGPRDAAIAASAAACP